MGLERKDGSSTCIQIVSFDACGVMMSRQVSVSFVIYAFGLATHFVGARECMLVSGTGSLSRPTLLSLCLPPHHRPSPF